MNTFSASTGKKDVVVLDDDDDEKGPAAVKLMPGRAQEVIKPVMKFNFSPSFVPLA